MGGRRRLAGESSSTCGSRSTIILTILTIGNGHGTSPPSTRGARSGTSISRSASRSSGPRSACSRGGTLVRIAAREALRRRRSAKDLWDILCAEAAALRCQEPSFCGSWEAAKALEGLAEGWTSRGPSSRLKVQINSESGHLWDLVGLSANSVVVEWLYQGMIVL